MSSVRLNVGDFGDGVTRLHDALRSQGFDVPDEEKKRRFFGPATREAVMRYQRACGLPETGDAEEQTMAALDKGLATERLLLPRARPLETVPTPELRPGILPEGPEAASVPREQPRASILPTPAGIAAERERTLAESIGVGLSVGHLGTAEGVAAAVREGHQSCLKGRIYLDNGLPAEGIVVRVYHRRFGGAETRLAETTTDAQGLYALPYDLGERAANLEVRTVDREGKELSLSATKYNAGRQEVLNLVAPADIRLLEPEYERLNRDLKQQVGDLSQLAAAQENAERQDLTLLHQATGWDARLIALAAMATRLSADTGMSSDVLYALLRVGLPSDKELLAMVSAETVERALGKAAEAGIAQLNEEQIRAAKTTFENYASSTRRAVKAPGALSSYGDMLDRSGLGNEERVVFEKLYFAHQGAPDELWQKAREQGLSEGKIDGLRLQGKLAFLTLNNADLTASLQRDIVSPENLARLVDMNLYKAETWKERIAAGRDPQTLEQLIPPAYTGATAAERLDAYAADMARKVRLSFPTRVVTQMVRNDEVHLGSNLVSLKERACAFLNAAENIGFELGRVPVQGFVDDHKAELFPNSSDKEIQEIVDCGEQLHRWVQLTPSPAALQAVAKLGFTSAHDIVALPYEDFMERFAGAFPSRLEQDLVYRKSQQIEAVTFNLITMANLMATTPPVYALFPRPASPLEARREQAKANLIRRFPSLEKLFGSLDYCECEHCRSVLSPAAYLVDLLHFLDPDPDPSKQEWQSFLNDWKKKHGADEYDGPKYNYKRPYDVLTRRRPDLPHLALTCENTNTAMPYIDLANEILEFYVANGQLTPAAVHDTGDTTTAELLAEPEHILTSAYERLNDVEEACYPLGLPFDLWLETVRRFLDHFETPLWKLLETLRTTDALFDNTKGYDRAAIFIESLGLSPAEGRIFTDPVVHAEWYKLYGYASADHALCPGGTKCNHLDSQGKPVHETPQLINAKTLSRRLGVSYKELVEIVKTGFVNPELDQLSIIWKLRVDPTEVLQYLNNKGRPEYAAAQKDFEHNLEVLLEETFGPLEEKKVITARLRAPETVFRLPEVRNPLTATRTALTGASAPREDNNATAKRLKEFEGRLEGLKGLFRSVLVLRDRSGLNNFDETYLEYADPPALPAAPYPDPLVFLKINLFVRLWRKLGWTIEETDRALQALMPRGLTVDEQNLGTALQTALIYMAHLKELDERVKIGKLSKAKLLTLWSNLSTTGRRPLYAQLFLTRSVLKNDSVFDDPFGNYLCYFDATEQKHKPFGWDPGKREDAKTGNVSLKSHVLAVQGALGLTADEVGRILTEAGLTLGTAALSLENVSLLYRYRLLATALKLPVRDLITLKQLAGLDPFKPLKGHPVSDYPRTDDKTEALLADHPFSQTLRFLDLAETVKESGIKIEDLDYLLRHRFDPVAKYRPMNDVPLALVKSLGAGIRRIQSENTVPADPASLSDELLRQKLALVLPADVAESSLGLLTGSAEYRVSENVPPGSALEPKDFALEPALQVSYDEERRIQHLSYRGLLHDGKKAQLKAANASPALASLLDKVQVEATERLRVVLELLVGTVEYTASQEKVAPSDKLQPKDFADEPAVRVSYDEKRQTQQLAYRGWLSDDSKAKLKAFNASPVVATLLDRVQLQAKELANELVRSFMGYWVGAVEFAAEQKPVEEANKLERKSFAPDSLSKEPGLRIDYDPQNKTQRLTYPGLLTDQKKARLAGSNPPQLLVDLLGNVQTQAVGFVKGLRVGFLAAADFDPAFASANLGRVASTTGEARSQLARAITPFLVRRLNQQLIVQTLATSLAADPALVEALLVDARLLTDPAQPGRPLLDAFANVGEGGVSATFFDQAAKPQGATATVASAETRLCKVNGAKGARFEGYLEAPTGGAYRFFVRRDKKDVRVELRFAHLPEPLLEYEARTDNDEISQFAELKSGVPYPFTLNVRDLDGDVSLLVQGENLPKGDLSRLTLYPQDAIERLHHAQVLLAKALQLIQGFNLNEREVRYLLTHAADFKGLDLSTLPVEEVEESNGKPQDEAAKAATKRFEQFLCLSDYARLKRELAGGTDDLIGVLERARCTYQEVTDDDKAEKAKTAHFEPLARLVRRDAEAVRAVHEALGLSMETKSDGNALRIETAALASVSGENAIGRIWKALQLVERIGIGVDQLAETTQIVSTSPAIRPFQVARGLRSMVKARYEPEAWQRIAQLIFDKLRQRQRDALVAYVMHQEGYERIEQLFEHFLIDPGMEPVVQTSRIRLAISSVQLFIQRCLLNLEPEVHPTAINSQHWQWMKRYRVWEANRKIFLFPENWLEPEFRDDKTYLFQELEGALLQGDVSNDLAEDAFFQYLKKLEELARLEIVTMYLDEKKDSASNTLHVIGRTYNLPHKYFYRRYSHHMWTPWEPVTAQIEGDHIVAVVWRDRLHLFWVTFLEKASRSKPPGDKPLFDKDATVGQIASGISTLAPSKTVEVQLNWSEYFQGKWTNRESSGFGNPIKIEMDNGFDSRQVFIHVSKGYCSFLVPVSEEESGEEHEPALLIHLSGCDLGQLGSSTLTAFQLANKNTQPQIAKREYPPMPPFHTGRVENAHATKFKYDQSELPLWWVEATGQEYTKTILRQPRDYCLLLCSDLQSEWRYPRKLEDRFFFEDSQHTFFVEPTLSQVGVAETGHLVLGIPLSDPKMSSEDWWKSVPVYPALPLPVKPPLPDPIDVVALFTLEQKQDWLARSATMIMSNGRLLTQGGRAGLTGLPELTGKGEIGRLRGALVP